MQSGVIRGHIRNEFITQHCQIIALNGCLLILPASFCLPHGSHGSHGFFFVASNGYSHLVSMEKLRRSRKSVRSVRSVWEKFNIKHSKINHHESKLEIRHQFRHHCPHRRPQLLLHAELRQPLSRSRISRIFKALGDEYLLPCHQH